MVPYGIAQFGVWWEWWAHSLPGEPPAYGSGFKATREAAQQAVDDWYAERRKTPKN